MNVKSVIVNACVLLLVSIKNYKIATNIKNVFFAGSVHTKVEAIQRKQKSKHKRILSHCSSKVNIT